MIEKRRVPTKRDFLEMYKKFGSQTGTVIDIGIFNETPEIKSIYKDTKQVLVEPLKHKTDAIRENYKDNDFELLNCAVSDSNCELFVQTYSIDGKTITHASLSSSPGKKNEILDTYKIKCITLDSLVEENQYKEPFLLKIDVDGVEEQILKGGRKMLSKCDVVIVETLLPTIPALARIVMDAGFVFYDMIDICYAGNRMWQVDSVFINKRVFDDVQKYPQINQLGAGIGIHDIYYGLEV